jgi:protocatechuate 3,4-dioxygenase beta subunit
MTHRMPKLQWLTSFVIIAAIASVWSAGLQSLAADEAQNDQTPAELTCTGIIQDALFGKPLVGAKVTIWKLAAPEAGQQDKSLAQFAAVTDAEGKYTFKLPTDHAWAPPPPPDASGQFRPSIRLQIVAKAANYAPRQISTSVLVEPTIYQGTSEGFSLPAKKVAILSQRSIEVLELRPGKEVTGILQAPDGKPVPGVKVVGHSQAPKNERLISDSLENTRRNNGLSSDAAKLVFPARDETVTDARGRFRVMMITPGEGMLAVYPDKDFAPIFKTVYDERGDLGTIKLLRGSIIQGRVLNEAGKPLAGVFIGADGEYQAPKYSDYSVDQQFRQTTESDAQGNFALGALPPGKYRIEPKSQLIDPARNPTEWHEPSPPKGIFPPQQVTLAEGQSPPKIEFRAVSSVVVSGRFVVNSPQAAGNFGVSAAGIRSWGRSYIQGTFDGLQYHQTLTIDGDGNFKLNVPKGLSEAAIQLFAGGNAQPQWRKSGEEQLHSDTTIDLGKLNDDVREIEVEYSSPLRGGRRAGFGGAAAPAAARAGRGAAANPAPAARGGRGGRGAANPRNGVQQVDENDAAKKEEEKPKEVTGTGSVIDADTGQPISGAKVRVWQYELVSQERTLNYIRHVDSVTDADGKYQFTLPTDHVEALANGATIIRVEPEVKHSEYVAPSQLLRAIEIVQVQGTSSALALRGGLLGGQRVADNEPIRELQPIEVIPGKEATGVLQSPEGKPVAGVRVFANPTAPIGQQERARLQSGLSNVPEDPRIFLQVRAQGNRPFGDDDTVTDADGRFRFLLPTSGECLLSIWPAEEFVPMQIQIHDKRGDIGVTTLRRGATLTGRVSDADGKALASVYLEARRVATDDKPATNVIFRAARTDAQGNFTFAPLPSGDYRVELRDAASDLTTEHRHDPPPEKHPLPGFFAPLKVTLADVQSPRPLEIRGTPTVVVSGHAAIPSELLDAVNQLNSARRATSSRFGAAGGRAAVGFAPAASSEPLSRIALLPQFAPSIRGKFNDFPFEAKGEIDAEGQFAIKVPRGLTDAVVLLHTAQASASTAGFAGNQNVGGSGPSIAVQPQWRAEKAKPLVTGSEIPLGDIESGVTEIEIVYSEEQFASTRSRNTSPANRRSPSANVPAAGDE